MAVRRFDADPLIVNAWQRLREGRHTPKDVQLLEHEIFEARFEGIFQNGLSRQPMRRRIALADCRGWSKAWRSTL